MLSLGKKQEIIIEQETRFAGRLSLHVLSRPPLHAWMIFIPFLFIFFIQDLVKYKNGLREFKRNYLLSRKKALQEAVDALTEDRKPDTLVLAKQANLKGNAMELYSQFLAVLAQHYINLLDAKGNTFEQIVKSAYDNKRVNFLLFINQLAKAEKSLNKVLMSQLSHTQDGVNTTIKQMEEGSNNLYREDAAQIFSCAA